MHLHEHGYLQSDCVICKCGLRDGILWVNTGRSENLSNGFRRDVLICSSCISDALKALASSIPDEETDDTDDSAVGGPVLTASN